MSYDYLGLTNDVATRLNETHLTTTDFSTAVGFYPAIKEAINASIRHINQAHFFWSFNHNKDTVTLTPGTSRYAVPGNAKYTAFDSFRVVRDITLGVGEGKHLKQLTYSEYLDKYIDQEYETDITKGAVPTHVVRTPDEEYVIVPMPDEAYEIEYEYFMEPTDLSAATDVPTIPERFRHVIIDGAMYYAYMFRDNIELANISQGKFEQGIKQMRTLLTNEYIYFRAS
jgi:hypothetical protein